MGIYKAKVYSVYNDIYNEIAEKSRKIERQKEDEYILEIKSKINPNKNKAISKRDRNIYKKLESVVIE